MPILLTTFGLLLLLTISAVSQLASSKNTSLLTIASAQASDDLQALFEQRIEQRAKMQRARLRPKEKKADAAFSQETEDAETFEATTSDHERPLHEKPSNESQGSNGRRTSFLHVGALFVEDDPNIVDGAGKAALILLQNYMRELYKDQPFYKEAKERYPDLEEIIIKKWIEETGELRTTQKEKGRLDKAKELSTLNLGDNQLMYVRYKMFTGANPRKKTKTDMGYYALSECISVKKSKQLLSLWLAPRALLSALFQNDEVVQELLSWRKETYAEIASRKSQELLETKSGECKSKFAASIPASIPKELIDFQVSNNRLAAMG